MIQSRLTKEQNEKKVMALSLEQKEKQVYWQRLIILFSGVALLSFIIGLLSIRRSNLIRKKINNELKLKNDQLENLNREINGLVSTIVHDLKSPFNTLQGIFGLIEMEKANPETLELLVHAKKAVRNGQDIIQQLLTIREAEENVLTIKKTAFDINELISDVTDDYISYAKEKEIAIASSLDGGEIVTDRIILRRILDNLVSNAVKFTPKNGDVKVSATRVAGVVRIEIADTGPGFSEKDLNKLFGKFQRLSARPTGGESSHGLGLAVVDILLKKINGTIRQETEAGKGARFIVEIPS
jgi:signal transduction histidine kinase